MLTFALYYQEIYKFDIACVTFIVVYIVMVFKG